MSLLARRIQPSPTTTIKAETNIPARGAPALQFINGRLVSYDDNFTNYIVKGYQFNDILYSIVKMQIDKASTTKWGVFKVVDENAYKIYRRELQNKDANFKKINDFFHKALQPNENAGKWNDLIDSPNSEQDFNDLYAELFAFILLTGNQFLWADILKAGANQGMPFELICQASQYMDIYTNGEFPLKKTGYNSSLYNRKFELNEIFHGREPNLSYDVAGSQVYGMSPIRAGLRRLQKANLQLTAETAGWNNEGIKGVFAFKVKPGEVEAEVMQSAVIDPFTEIMRNEWQGATNRKRMGVSGYDLSWIPVGLNSEEMELIASGQVDLRSMCNWYGVPSQLLNDPENKIYANQKEGEKAFTSRCVVPKMCRFRDSFVRFAKKYWNFPKDSVIDFDLTYFPELQNDINTVVDSTNKLVAVIPNEQREQAGNAAIDNPIFNEPWIMVGGSRMPLSEYQMNQVDNALNNDPNNP